VDAASEPGSGRIADDRKPAIAAIRHTPFATVRIQTVIGRAQ